MNRYHIVKEYIEYYMQERRLTTEEFCKICEIQKNDFCKVLANKDYDLSIVEKISNYINVPMKKLYVDLDNKPIIDGYELEQTQKNRFNNIFFFD